MSKRTKFLAIGALLSLAAMSIVAVRYLVPDPVTNANANRIKEGMPFSEVELILGEAGPSYSSLADRDYRIWKGRDGWIRIWLVQGKVTNVEFSPGLPMDDQTLIARFMQRIIAAFRG